MHKSLVSIKIRLICITTLYMHLIRSQEIYIQQDEQIMLKMCKLCDYKQLQKEVYKLFCKTIRIVVCWLIHIEKLYTIPIPCRGFVFSILYRIQKYTEIYRHSLLNKKRNPTTYLHITNLHVYFQCLIL